MMGTTKLYILISVWMTILLLLLVRTLDGDALLYSRKRLSSPAPLGCHRVCPSVVSVLATSPAPEHYVVDSAAVDVLQS